MKYAAQFCALLLALALGGFSGNAASFSSKNVRLSGREYIPLKDWARANQFAVRWVAFGKTLQISNRTAKVDFSVDPRTDRSKAVFNGVQISLAFPIYYQNGTAYISQLDLTQTLSPLLWPPRNSPGIRVKTICIDPGHGGKDPGNQAGPYNEKKYTLLLAQEVRDQLRAAGFNAVLTRSTDYFILPKDRPPLARKAKADLFVSLHFNDFSGSSGIRGIETYCLTPMGAYSSNSGGEGDTRWVSGNRNNEKNMLLAYQLHRSMVNALPVEDRGVKRARFKVLTDATMPAVLVEGGFMSNSTEMKRIADPAYRRQMARAIVNGILAYRKIING
ncbi:MAG TPA: N-acetylmuramoyl-L-alanine amidase [Candidatus Paceibacterota bacterium]|nr:N-acetylmuramoyl-L-alanine amidase [Candidatus Paceibacterota bacterium]